jgi:transposase
MLLEADLPSDPHVLRTMLVATMAQLRSHDEELGSLRAANEQKQAEIALLHAVEAEAQAEIVRLGAVNDHAEAELARLHDIIAALRRHRFGARSEKLDDEQLELAFEDTETALAVVAASLDAVAPTPREPRRRKTNRGLPAHLPRVEQVVDIENKACGCCGGALHVIGEDVSERLDVVPTTFRVLVTRRPRYGCRGCEAAPVQAPAPAHIIDGGLPSEALVAQVLVSKYADHLPLYRQAQIYARQGVELDRSTLADWTGRAAWWLRPLRDHLLDMLKRSGKLFADETVAPVLDPGRGRTKRGQLWAYARDDRPWGGSDPPAVAYRYAPDRKAEQPTRHLAGFRGVLQVDGYAAYRKLARAGDVQLAFCWAHVRRRFFEQAASGTSPVATDVLARTAQLYAVEADIRGQSADARRAVRQERSRVIIDDLRRVLDMRLGQISRKGGLAEAIRYALSHWDGLCRFLDDGRIELDSNTVERSIRPLTLNRKNALFAGSDDGGDNWAVIASLIDLMPWTYAARVVG